MAPSEIGIRWFSFVIPFVSPVTRRPVLELVWRLIVKAWHKVTLSKGLEMTGTGLTINLSVVLDEAELDALEDLRLKKRLPSQEEAIREVIRSCLRDEAFDIVGPR